jgi:hypothetical protein
MVERFLGTEEVVSSILTVGSMCLVICAECRGPVGDVLMPPEIRAKGMGEQLVWLATQPVGPMTCFNKKCSNYLRTDDVPL